MEERTFAILNHIITSNLLVNPPNSHQDISFSEISALGKRHKVEKELNELADLAYISFFDEEGSDINELTWAEGEMIGITRQGFKFWRKNSANNQQKEEKMEDTPIVEETTEKRTRRTEEREEQNGIKRPRKYSQSGVIWSLIDENKELNKFQILDFLKNQGFAGTIASATYRAWCTFHGIEISRERYIPEEKNGVKKPRPGTKSACLWTLFDENINIPQNETFRIAIDQGYNIFTVACQFRAWKIFNEIN